MLLIKNNKKDMKFIKCSFDELINKLKNISLKKITDSVRIETDQKKKQEIKRDNLASFYVADFKDRIIDDNFISSQYLLFDIDKLPNVNEVYKLFTQWDYTLLCFVSVSGNGVKVVCKLSDHVTDIEEYRNIWKFRKTMIEQNFGMDIDKGDISPAHGSYFAYCDDVYFNESCKTLDIETIEEEERYSIQDDKILSECADVLKDKVNDYMLWISCGFALSNIGDKGYKYFEMISWDKAEAKKKWKDIIKRGKAKASLSFFVKLAMKHGADVKLITTVYQNGKEIVCPFITGDDGLYFMNRKGESHRISTFKKIKHLYNIKKENDYCKVVEIDDSKIVEFPSQSLCNVQTMKKTVAGQNGEFIGRWLGNEKDLDYFAIFIDDLDTGLEAKEYSQIGKIDDLVWNLGNKILKINKVEDYQKIVWIDKKGYMLKLSDEINIDMGYNYDHLKGMVNEFIKWYGINSILVYGFVTSTLFLDTITGKYGLFPHLYIYGEAGSGKSSTLPIILSMFGMNDKGMAYQNLSNKSTANAISRISSELHNLPLVLDEYSDEYHNILKSRYDYKKRYRAKTSNDNEIHSNEQNCSTIFATRHLPAEQEALERCIFMKLQKHDRENNNVQEFFNNLYLKKHILSKLILFILAKVKKEQLLDNIGMWIDRMESDEDMKCIDSRLKINYAVYLGGYETFKSLHIVSNGYSNEEILQFVKEELFKSQTISEGSSQAKIFMDYFSQLVENSSQNIHFKEEITINGNKYEDVYVFSFPTVYSEVKRLNNVSNKYIMGSKTDVLNLLKETGYILDTHKGVKSIRMNDLGNKSLRDPVIIKKDYDTDVPF